MINKQRVQRIRNLIYVFIILVLFLPLVLMSILSFRMIGLAEKMSVKLDEINSSVSQGASPSSSPSGFVIEPEGQASNPAPGNNTEEQNKTESSSQVASASGNQPEAIGAAPSESPSDPGENPQEEMNISSGASGTGSPAQEGASQTPDSPSAEGNPSTGQPALPQFDTENNPLTGR